MGPTRVRAIQLVGRHGIVDTPFSKATLQVEVARRATVTEEYDKLVRDRIPEIIERNGERPVVHVADEREYGDRLVDKLFEEAEEYRENGELAELADVLEVVHALRTHHGASEEELDRLRAEKADERGRFEERIVLERVE